jgi:3-oxoacyl-[acyl-carrier-protein] synthase II
LELIEGQERVKNRVVVTGMGVVAPVGNTLEEFWRNLCAGKSGIGPITKFDAREFSSQIAGEIKEFDPENYIERKEVKKMDTFIHYAIAASEMAVKHAQLPETGVDKTRVGVLIGSGIGGLGTIEAQHKVLLEKGPRRITPFFIPMLLVNLASGQVAMRYGFSGPNSAVSTACATGVHAIGEAFKMIQCGLADAMIAGGSEAVITPLAVGGFCAMRALSQRNHDPAAASRPFEKDRDGFIIAEGAGIIVLESAEYAQARGATILAELIGYGLTADAYHVTSPDPEAAGTSRCMQMALDDAQIAPEAIDYINAHGTSTPLNDKFETMSIKKVFGEHAARLQISSTKSMTGHLLGAAGGIESVATIMTIAHDMIPPTINYDTPDPECDLDYVPNVARHATVTTALTNSFGFGGTNGTLIFRKFQALS